MKLVSTACACLAALGFVLSARGARQAAVAPPPREIAAPDLPGLTVVLAWNAPVDLDLYVTDPTWETVYFANNPSRSGARLRKDVRCADVGAPAGPFQEIVHIADVKPGGYRVGVDLIDPCGSDLTQAGFRVGCFLAGQPPQEQQGTIHLEQFQPRVLDYVLTEADLAPAEAPARGGTR